METETATITATANQMAGKRTVPQVATPVTILWNSVLMLPLVGVIDSKRGQEIMETMLAKIMSTGSKVIILDIQGVATVDSAVANHLTKIAKAVKLMGARCLVTGIVPAIAQTLVHLGIELGDFTTKATLKDGLEYAFDILGLEVREIKSASPRKSGA